MEVIRTRSRKSISVGAIKVGSGELLDALRLLPSSADLKVLTGDSFSRERVKLTGLLDVIENSSQLTVPMEAHVAEVSVYFRLKSVDVYVPYDQEVTLKPFLKRMKSFQPWLNALNNLFYQMFLYVALSFALARFLGRYVYDQSEKMALSALITIIAACLLNLYLYYRNVSIIYDDQRASFFVRNRDLFVAILAIVITGVVDYFIP